ncbi:hypothetical protein [Paenibacillus spongiae]|uniref:Phage tail tape measure protein n=1 Tax=Paenibacillus spongiae TaxID=2909671 RepID=A0ABY5SF30_9BACL|nr:hypothetical protein [Paenibacillus spongiae]UVI32090.1 hypothetical protein L1F29_09835 [Paenibacillus spongiae]
MAKLTNLISLKDNYSAPLKKAQRLTSEFRKDVNKTKKAMDAAAAKRYEIKVQTSKAWAAIDKVKKKMDSVRSFTVNIQARHERFMEAISPVTSVLGKLTRTPFRIGITAVDMASRVLAPIAKILLAITGAGGAVAAGLGAVSIKGAATRELQQIQLEALVGDKKRAKQLFDDMNKRGAISTFSESDFLEGAKAFLPLTKDLKQINQLASIQERLAASNPMEGMGGAAFSIREGLSGDTVSLAERFNIPKQMLANLKTATSFNAKIKEFDKILNKLGYTQGYLNKVNKAATSQWDNFKSNLSTGLAKAGTQALEVLKPLLVNMNGFMQSERGAAIFKAWGDGLGWAAEKAIQLGTNVKVWIEDKFINNPAFQNADWGTKFGMILDQVTPVLDAWYNDSFKPWITGIWTKIEPEIKPLVEKLGKSIGDALKSGLGSAVKDHPILSGLTAGALIPGPLQAKAAVATGVATAGAVADKAAPALILSHTLSNAVSDSAPSWSKGAIEKVQSWFTFGGNKKAVGMRKVPSDNYPALLHRGETVLTGREAEQYRNGQSNSGSMNFTFNINGSIGSNENEMKRFVSLLRTEFEKVVINMP